MTFSDSPTTCTFPVENPTRLWPTPMALDFSIIETTKATTSTRLGDRWKITLTAQIRITAVWPLFISRTRRTGVKTLAFMPLVIIHFFFFFFFHPQKSSHLIHKKKKTNYFYLVWKEFWIEDKKWKKRFFFYRTMVSSVSWNIRAKLHRPCGRVRGMSQGLALSLQQRVQ